MEAAIPLPAEAPAEFSLLTCYQEDLVEAGTLTRRSYEDDLTAAEESVMSRVLCGWSSYENGPVGMTYDQAVRRPQERPLELSDIYDAVATKNQIEALPALPLPSTVEIVSVSDLLSDDDLVASPEDSEDEDEANTLKVQQIPNTTAILEDTIRQLQAEVQDLEAKSKRPLSDSSLRPPLDKENIR